MKANSYVEPFRKSIRKVYINGPGYMTKIATTSIYGIKTFKSIFSRARNHMSRVVRKPVLYICENKDADKLRISAFVFATRIVKSLYFLNPKFQAFSYLVWLYSPDCVGPGRKPRRPVFSQRGSYYLKTWHVGLETQGLQSLNK